MVNAVVVYPYVPQFYQTIKKDVEYVVRVARWVIGADEPVEGVAELFPPWITPWVVLYLLPNKIG